MDLIPEDVEMRAARDFAYGNHLSRHKKTEKNKVCEDRAAVVERDLTCSRSDEGHNETAIVEADVD